MSEFSRDFTILNDKGLHARASARFVEVVENFNSEVIVQKDGLSASGSSIMGLLMLAASKGTNIKVTLNGDDAEELSLALDNLIQSKFGEEN
ncbi:MAG: HPr family phosphocarrier protein [Rhodobacteraceae bacterium TMED111]|nr:HPr family phosphocarrier protein [Marinovum sp.]OUV41528.1 MAG: HPr family phosphocarrier protein [Rhodobacteraceae bacterium TMED111]|tara:strand:+ start:145 stop:420 length:276 start_codon:yes stop_codon:yes gene_type:complete